MFSRNRPKPTDPSADGAALLARNRDFYSALWRRAALVAPERFATWALIGPLAAAAPSRLELAPGLRPRLPIRGTHFLDLCPAALGPLAAEGGAAVCGIATKLPFADASFTLLAALDVIEHVDDDETAFAELARVAADDATLLLSVPLHKAAWSGFDHVVGHARRYDPDHLASLLARHGFAVEQSAPSGMRPRFPGLALLGLWFLAHCPGHAMTIYNSFFLPLGLRWQKPLLLQEGMIPTERADGV
ncbi:MAG: methyltransferase domain-containing protein, partial [Alphaproteobacteria bacterium]|nr:methyltransferase domain-containing protein [Alphaproteobacteria bacterium]